MRSTRIVGDGKNADEIHTSPNDNEGEQTITLYFWDGGVGGSFETFQNAIADLPSMVEVLEKEYYDPLQSFDAKY